MCTKLQINADIIWRSWTYCTYSALSTAHSGLKLHPMLTIATTLELWSEIFLTLMLKQAFMGNYVVVFGNRLSNLLKSDAVIVSHVCL